MNSDPLPLLPTAKTAKRGGARPRKPVRGFVDTMLRRRSPADAGAGGDTGPDAAPGSIALTLINSLREPLAFVTRTGGHWMLTGGNAALAGLLRRPAATLAGLPLAEILVRAPGAVDRVEQALERGDTTPLRGQAIDRAGGLHRVMVRAEPVGPAGPLPAGGPAGQALLYLDPLEAEVDALREATRRLHEAEDRLRRQSADLERMQREIDAFGAMLSHDLRAPLRMIDDFARRAVDEQGDAIPAAALDHLRRIRTAGARMNGMIDALRDLSVVTGRTPQRRPIDLGDLAREVITEMRRAPADASALPVHRPIRLRIAGGMVVEADPTMMRLLLVNLLGNAIKFTAPRDEPAIDFGVSTDTGRCVFHIRDNGIGFDIVHGQRLFGLFQRLPGAEAFPGHGIGLALCRRVVRRFGGEIWASGLPGEGACFYFTVPG